MAQERDQVERLIFIAPAFNMMGVRAKAISPNDGMIGTAQGGCLGTMIRSTESGRCPGNGWKKARRIGRRASNRLRRVRTSILHGSGDTVIAPEGSREFADLLRRRDPCFPVDSTSYPGIIA